MPEMTLFKDTAIKVVGRGYLSSDHISTATGLDPAITISKNGGNFANPNAGASVMTEIQSTGWYYFSLAAEDTDTLGPLIIRGTHATMDDIEVVYQVVAANVGIDWGNVINQDATVYLENTTIEAISTSSFYAKGIVSSNGGLSYDYNESTVPAGVAGNTSFVDANWDGEAEDFCKNYKLFVANTYRMYRVVSYAAGTNTITVDMAMIAGDAGSVYALMPDAAAGGGASAADVWAYETRELTALDEDNTTIDLDGSTIGTVTTVTNGVTLADDAITAGKYDETTAWPLTAADTGATAVARTGADSDTLETLSDEIDAVSSQISGIGSGTGAALNFPVTEDNASAPLNGVTKIGTQTGTFANTLANDGSVHAIASALDGGTQKILWVYGFDVGAGRSGTKVVFRAAMAATGDTVTLKAYNFGTSTWDTRTTLVGTASQLLDIPLLAGHTGTGANAGKVYLEIVYDEGDAGAINVNEVYCQAQNLGQTVGYTDGSIWVDTNASNTNVTPFVDGTGDNPVSTWAAALTLSASVGIKSFRFLPGSSIQLTANSENYRLVGDATIDLNGQAITNTLFRDCYTISGVSSGDDWFMNNCGIGTATLAHGYAVGCRLKGTITLLDSQEYYFIDCTDTAGGVLNNSTLVYAASAEVVMRGWKGAISLNGHAATNNTIIDGAGRVIIDTPAAAAGTITMRGFFPVATGAATFGGTLTDDQIYTESILLAGVNTEVDNALNTAIPGSPTADSINQRIAAIDDLTQASGAGDLAAILVDTSTTLDDLVDDLESRLTATRAGYLDNLSAGAVALASEVAKVPKSDGSATWNNTALASLQQEATDALNAYDPPTKAELDAADDAVLAAIAALNNLSSAGAQAAAAAALTAYGAALETTSQSILVDTGTDIPASLTTISGKVDTIDDYIDTEIAAIKAKTDLITAPVTLTIVSAVSGSTITIQRGDTLSADVNGLGSVADYVSLDFTVKENAEDLDSEALLRIRLNASGLSDGLLVLNGATAADDSKGAITIDDAAAGDITIALSADVADDLAEGTYVYDIQKISATTVRTMTSGTCIVARDVTRAVV